jgi:hypothetical protein
MDTVPKDIVTSASTGIALAPRSARFGPRSGEAAASSSDRQALWRRLRSDPVAAAKRSSCHVASRGGSRSRRQVDHFYPAAEARQAPVGARGRAVHFAKNANSDAVVRALPDPRVLTRALADVETCVREPCRARATRFLRRSTPKDFVDLVKRETGLYLRPLDQWTLHLRTSKTAAQIYCRSSQLTSKISVALVGCLWISAQASSCPQHRGRPQPRRAV